jgi:hypothetical protein
MSISTLYYPFPGTPLQVTVFTRHKTGRLLAVSPDMAELPAVVTLRESNLSFVRLYPDCNMATANQNLWDFDVLGKVMTKKGMFAVVVFLQVINGW